MQAGALWWWVSARAILRWNCFVAEAPALSVTLMVNTQVPGLVGTPLIMPLGLSDSRGGRCPETSDQT